MEIPNRRWVGKTLISFTTYIKVAHIRPPTKITFTYALGHQGSVNLNFRLAASKIKTIVSGYDTVM